MRTAYCISAYKDAPQLDRLIGALEGDDTRFIVHVDKRIGDIEPFRRAVAKHKDARMTTRRYLVQWGSWAQVRYQQLFLEEALAAGADRIFIISGQDYPLWSNDRLHSYCTDNADRAFVIGLDLTALPPPYAAHAPLLGAVASVSRPADKESLPLPRYHRRPAHTAAGAALQT